MFSSVVLSILSFASFAVAQKDPLKDFCRLFGHQTTVVDRQHYIDGGIANFGPLNEASLNYTSTWLRKGDLDDNNEGFPKHSLKTKNDSVPSVHGGILWADEPNKVIYQFGGEFGSEKPEEFKLWYYDIVYDTWNVSDTRASEIQRAAWGAGTVAQDRGRGYYYGGHLNNLSVPGYASTPTILDTMLVYDMLGNTFRNQTGPDGTGRAEGSMVYVPAGDAGLLVYYGGIQDAGNGTVKAVPMTEIFVYDVGNDKWYKQNATGSEIPGERRRFCSGVVWAQDKSSYNIYLYGGASIENGFGYGDVWVLSMPSFQWIKFWPRDGEEAGDTFPHHSLSCDVIDNQMIIMGGHFTNFTDCDVPLIYGQHGLDLGKSNANGAKWAAYNASVTQYNVPSEIISSIGGGATGGATNLTPKGGFGHRDLQVQMTRAYKPTGRAPTRNIPTATGATAPESSGSNRGAIIGGAVGGGIGGLLMVAGVGVGLLFYRRRKNKASNAKPNDKSFRPASELPSHQDPKSPAASHYTQYTGFPPSPGTTHPGSPPDRGRGWSLYGPPHPAPAYPGSPDAQWGAGPLPQKQYHDQAWSPGGDSYHARGHPQQMPPQELPASSLETAELPSEPMDSTAPPKKN
ncbi:hypothetical protein BDV95DRAFT_593628 [Massariosphaeria phaeospora]|uniref:Kelch repeat protein-like protein n=1 Tax=Massariosphaeria phaeospora TaxID=100035 RepID=A0A7C8MN56_9PLEO|nr:hypothetical protein BDV95DRAFT_593628 [Massariosphaeria phaeospora]